MKKHIYEIDFIRTSCCLGIVIYHFASHTNSNIGFLNYTVNYDIGSIIVTVFFMVSGFVLYHNNKEIKSLKAFYYKRFKSIFPSFWLCWFIFYVINVIKVRTPFYAGNPLKLLLTLIGQDGYFLQRVVNYYTVGEWFLGALIIVYALYPLLLKGYKKNNILTLAILIVLTAIIRLFNIPVISPGFPGICECCLKLYLGILLYEQINKLNKATIIASIVYIIAYTIIRFNYINVASDIIYSICLFIGLYKLGSILVKNNQLNKTFKFIGGISYQIFLLQHMVNNYVFEFYNPSSTIPAILTLLICIVLTIIFAYIINLIIKKLMNTKPLKNIENKLLLDK